MSHQQQTQPTVFGRLFIAVTTFIGAWFCYERSMAGQDIAGFGDVGGLLAIVLASLSLAAAIGFLNAWDRVRDRSRRDRDLGALSDKQGTAHIGSTADAEKHGLLSGQGFICGTLEGKLVTVPTEKSMIVYGPPGSRKGTNWVLPNLLASDHWKVLPSWVTLDISAELYFVTRRRLIERGYDVVVLCPEPEQLEERLGRKIENCVQSNPAEFLSNSNNPKDDAEMLAQLIYPGTPKGQASGSTEHFDELARLILTMWILWLLWQYGKVTLPGLRRCVMSTNDETAAAIAKMQTDGASVFGGALSEMGSSIEKMMEATDEYSGAITTCTRAVRVFSAGAPAGVQVSEHHFDWGRLRERPTAVFIIVPPERLDTYTPWINVVLSCGIETLARLENKRPVFFLLDEIGNIYVPNLPRLISVYRKFGLSAILILQTLRAQLTRWYGKDATDEIITGCESIQSFSPRSLADLKETSELSGSATVVDGSRTLREGSGGEPELSYSGNFRSEPILRVEDLRRMGEDKTLLMHGNAPPLLLDGFNYLERLAEHADANPYYRNK